MVAKIGRNRDNVKYRVSADLARGVNQIYRSWIEQLVKKSKAITENGRRKVVSRRDVTAAFESMGKEPRIMMRVEEDPDTNLAWEWPKAPFERNIKTYLGPGFRLGRASSHLIMLITKHYIMTHLRGALGIQIVRGRKTVNNQSMVQTKAICNGTRFL